MRIIPAFLALLLTASVAVALPRGSGQSGTATVATVNLYSTSGGPVTTPTVRFAHLFKDGDIPSGQVLTITSGGQSVQYTAARRNLWPSGSLRAVDLLLEMPNNISTSAVPVLLGKTSGSWASTDTLPGGKTIANIVTDITSNNDDEWIEL